MRTWTEDRAIQPRYSRPIGGVDLGSQGVVLAEVRLGNKVHKRLVWLKGGTRADCGVRGSGQDSFPTSLCVIQGNGISVCDIFREGRISKKRLLEHRDKIDNAMDCPVTDKINPAKTLYVVVDESDMDNTK